MSPARTRSAAPPPTPAWREALELPDVGLVARIVRLNLFVTRVLEELTSDEGISPSDYLVLGVLRRSPNHRSSPSQMCEILGRSSGGMTLTLDRLEAAGWVGRTHDPRDRRRVLVTLTPEGEALSTKVNDALHEWENALNLDQQQRDQTVRFVDELIGIFERATESNGI
jgi:DNA-binding MarR family transcriptional regulator